MGGWGGGGGGGAEQGLGSAAQEFSGKKQKDLHGNF